MKVFDIGSGSKSLRKPVLDLRGEYMSLDINEDYDPDIVMDFTHFKDSDFNHIGFVPDVVWFSPPCTTYSIAGISHHRTKVDGNLDAHSDEAFIADALIKNFLSLQKDFFWYMENPRGGLRKMDFMQPYEHFRATVTYCQYGDTRMKPTDIWTNNANWHPRPMCKNGDPCHVSAPRGSRTGTQGLKNNHERSRVPYDLLYEILVACK
jgi:hypothetical protein